MAQFKYNPNADYGNALSPLNLNVGQNGPMVPGGTGGFPTYPQNPLNAFLSQMPNLGPQTRGQQLMQNLNPDVFTGNILQGLMGAPGKIGSGLSGWWNSPNAPQPAAPASGIDTNALLSDYLSGLTQGQGKSGFSVPGTNPNIKLPSAPELPPADYSQALAMAQGAAPPEAVTPLSQQTYPGALSPEEQDKLIGKAKWGAAAEAALSRPQNAGIGDLLFAAGLGGLMGKRQETEQLRKEGVTRQEKQFEYNVAREEKNLDRQDRLTRDRTEYSLKMAGLQGEQAKAVADAHTESLKLQYNSQVEQAKLEIDNARIMEPKIISLGPKGVAILTRGPNGEQNVDIKPLNLGGLSGLTGAEPGIEEDLNQLQSSGGDPFLAAHMMVLQLGAGRQRAVFGPGYDDAVKEVSAKMPKDFRTMGTAGEKMWAQQYKNELDWKLTEGLMQHPELLKAAHDMLRKTTVAPQAPIAGQ